jgi:hypothetical protein
MSFSRTKPAAGQIIFILKHQQMRPQKQLPHSLDTSQHMSIAHLAIKFKKKKFPSSPCQPPQMDKKFVNYPSPRCTCKAM